MARAPHLTVDPARDAASLLRRIGFVGLMVGLPLAGFWSRTGAVLVLAIAVPVIAIAALVDEDRRPLAANLGRLAAEPAFAAVLVGAGWALASSIWAPAAAPSATGSGIVGVLGVVALGLLAFLALPERMRSANLYPMAIGAPLAAFVGIALAFGWLDEPRVEAVRRAERGFSILVAYAWPALAWLRSRGRDAEAVGLALLVAAGAALAPTAVPVLAFAAGALAYLAIQVLERPGAIIVGTLLAVAILAAPVAVWLLARDANPAMPGWTSGTVAWRDALFAAPRQLLTGHGAGALKADPALVALPSIVGAPLLAAWYELGIVGAAAAAVAIWTAFRAAAASFGPLLPGLGAGIVTALAIGMTGIDGGALWWPAALATIAVLFVAAERGQFRTRRPRALIFFRRPAKL